MSAWKWQACVAWARFHFILADGKHYHEWRVVAIAPDEHRCREKLDAVEVASNETARLILPWGETPEKGTTLPSDDEKGDDDIQGAA